MSDPRSQDPFLATEELPARSGLVWAHPPVPDEPPGSADPVTDAADDEDLDLLDQGWSSPQRMGRITAALAAGLVALLGFVGGALVQKQHDTGLAGSSPGGPANAARQFARANGFVGGGAPGGFGTGAAGIGQGGSTGSGGTGSGGTGTASGTPVVVGTVASVGQGTLVVLNFAGAKVTVHVPAGTPVTTVGLTGLRAGMTVSVTGTKGADGTVTATSVSSRSNG